jgi:hypothetical protein
MNFLAVEGKDVKEDMKSCQISTIIKYCCILCGCKMEKI